MRSGVRSTLGSTNSPIYSGESGNLRIRKRYRAESAKAREFETFARVYAY